MVSSQVAKLFSSIRKEYPVVVEAAEFFSFDVYIDKMPKYKPRLVDINEWRNSEEDSVLFEFDYLESLDTESQDFV